MNDPTRPTRKPTPIPANLGKPGGPRFLDVLNYHLGVKLQKFAGKDKVLNRETMEEMYETVIETVGNVFEQSKLGFNGDTIVWVCQQMYECIKVGSSPIITRDESTWTHDVRPVYEKKTLERVPDQDLRIVAGLFNEATFAPKILDELKRRGMR